MTPRTRLSLLAVPGWRLLSFWGQGVQKSFDPLQWLPGGPELYAGTCHLAQGPRRDPPLRLHLPLPFRPPRGAAGPPAVLGGAA